MKLNELNQFFDTYDKVESRIAEVAPLCTNICSCEEITGFRNCGDGDICISVWSQDCGNDAYFFPLKYLAMEDDEIAKCEKKKAEEQRRLVEIQKRKEKKRLERQERREYERRGVQPPEMARIENGGQGYYAMREVAQGRKSKVTLEEIDPELFLWELYNANGLHELDDALCTDAKFGYCDASRLRVRPKAGEYALMVEWWNGTKYWCHADKQILESIEFRLARNKGQNNEY